MSQNAKVFAVLFVITLVSMQLSLATSTLLLLPSSSKIKGIQSGRSDVPHSVITQPVTAFTWWRFQGAYMVTHVHGFFIVNGVRIQSSFPSTNPSVIGNDFLESVLAVRGFDHVNSWDYEYVATYGLVSNGSVYYGFEEWVAINGFPNATYRTIWSWTTGYVTPDYSLSTPVLMQMVWVGGSINVTFTVNGVIKHSVQDCMTCRVSTANPNFGVGLIYNTICCQYPWNDSYGLLFGVNGESGVFRTGWNVLLEYPSYRNSTNSPWQLVSEAASIGGLLAWITHAIAYGGYNYDNVTAVYSRQFGGSNDPCYDFYRVKFYYSNTEISDQQILWNAFVSNGGNNPNDAGSGGDAGDCFSTATPIAPGSYTGHLNGAYDTQDWYQFPVYKTNIITATVTPPAYTMFNLELYNDQGLLEYGYYPGTPGAQAQLSSFTVCDGAATTSTAANWRLRVFTSSSPYAGNGTGAYTLSFSVGSGGSCDSGGGGSIMAGTQVLMSDGSTMAVNNIQAGMVVRSYDPASSSFYNATVTSLLPKSVNNLYIIGTSNGNPIRVDYYENFWVQLPDGGVRWMPAGQVQVGYKILMPTTGIWSLITYINTATGSFTVYDLIITPTLPGGPMPVIANGYLDMKTH